MNMNDYLIVPSNSNKTLKLESLLSFLNKQLDGLDGGNHYSYYQFSHKGMEIFLQHLKDDAKMSNNSMFVDVGSGKGNTVFCVANQFKPIMCYGIEGDENRYLVIIFKRLNFYHAIIKFIRLQKL
jgi:hypothetical protein